ncbi:hypothetical protein ACFL3J_02305 [Candidatus Omnitrophota bacterium]
MNLAIGALVLLGLLLPLIGIVSKFMGIGLLDPWIAETVSYIPLANFCLLLALIVDKYDKKQK